MPDTVQSTAPAFSTNSVREREPPVPTAPKFTCCGVTSRSHVSERPIIGIRLSAKDEPKRSCPWSCPPSTGWYRTVTSTVSPGAIMSGKLGCMDTVISVLVDTTSIACSDSAASPQLVMVTVRSSAAPIGTVPKSIDGTLGHSPGAMPEPVTSIGRIAFATSSLAIWNVDETIAAPAGVKRTTNAVVSPLGKVVVRLPGS